MRALFFNFYHLIIGSTFRILWLFLSLKSIFKVNSWCWVAIGLQGMTLQFLQKKLSFFLSIKKAISFSVSLLNVRSNVSFFSWNKPSRYISVKVNSRIDVSTLFLWPKPYLLCKDSKLILSRPIWSLTSPQNKPFFTKTMCWSKILNYYKSLSYYWTKIYP